MNNAAMNHIVTVLGRLGLALIFILTGWSKIGSYEGAGQYMQAMGVSPLLLPVVIAVELLGGLAIVLGFATRWVALGLAVFTLLAGVFFHGNLGDQNQFTHFFKNVAIAGGFLILFANGAGAASVDGWLQARRITR